MNYLLGALAAIIGILVLMLRGKGTALHRAQIQLLSLRLATTSEQDAEAVKKARDAFTQAHNAYLRAKGGK
jgi:uncharacterized membrane protein